MYIIQWRLNIKPGYGDTKARRQLPQRLDYSWDTTHHVCCNKLYSQRSSGRRWRDTAITFICIYNVYKNLNFRVYGYIFTPVVKMFFVILPFRS